jgi:hypothetical protein
MASTGTAEGFYQTYRDQGFIVIDLVAENEASQPADQYDAAEVAADHGLSYPVLADPGWIVGDLFDLDDDVPNKSLLAPGLEVVIVDATVGPPDIEAVLP